MSQPAPEDVRDLAGFGYRQDLDRTLGGFSSFAAGFSYISILTGLSQLFYLGFGAGGPAFFWTWPAVFVGQFAVALCFAELAAHYPLSGGVYQWSKHTGSRALGWMTGWIYLACSVITLASVALALQVTLPRITPWLQLVGDPNDKAACAMNAVLLGCALIALTTLINAVGVRLMSRINNLGVLAEIIGALLLTFLLALHARRGPEVVFDTQGRGAGKSLGYLGPFLAAALTACFVMYGFDTAGTLAEETERPRLRAPWAILQALAAAAVAGALLMLFALLAVGDIHSPELSSGSGGLPFIVKDTLGKRLGTVFLADVAFAIFVCSLAVHAGAVRLMFAMARDNNLPFSRALAQIRGDSRTPILPAIVVGLLATLILVVNINFPQIIEVLTSVAVVWANLTYLLVTVPLLRMRLAGWPFGGRVAAPGVFSMGRWGLPVNVMAVAWGGLVVLNIGWPRPEIYGAAWYRRYGAVLSTGGVVALGAAYYGLVRRHHVGILEDHRA